MPYYVYILKSFSADRYYIGTSENPWRRLEYHNTIEKGFTSRYRPWEIAYTLEFPDKQIAQLAERKIKSWKSKTMIQKLIVGQVQI